MIPQPRSSGQEEGRVAASVPQMDRRALGQKVAQDFNVRSGRRKVLRVDPCQQCTHGQNAILHHRPNVDPPRPRPEIRAGAVRRPRAAEGCRRLHATASDCKRLQATAPRLRPACVCLCGADGIVHVRDNAVAPSGSSTAAPQHRSTAAPQPTANTQHPAPRNTRAPISRYRSPRAWESPHRLLIAVDFDVDGR